MNTFAGHPYEAELTAMADAIDRLLVQSEAVYRCAYCSTVVRSDDDASRYPYCSALCSAQAEADNK